MLLAYKHADVYGCFFLSSSGLPTFLQQNAHEKATSRCITRVPKQCPEKKVLLAMGLLPVCCP